jgi:hypothetical protein
MVHRTPAARNVEPPRNRNSANGPNPASRGASPGALPEAEILTLDFRRGGGVLHPPAPAGAALEAN